MKRTGERLLHGHYHIILVPEDASKTKRLQLSSVTARLVVLTALMVLPLLLGALFSTLHFQNKVVALRQQISDDSRILEEKDLLVTKIAQLERSLKRTEGSLSQLEKALRVESGQMKTGLGPLEGDFVSKSFAPGTPSGEETEAEFMQDGSLVSLRDIRQRISTMDDRIEGVHGSVDELFEFNLDKITILHSLPDTMPVHGWVTSDFGFRRHPYSGRYKMHTGIDIACPVGTPVRASADGLVLHAGRRGGYGNAVIVDHGFGVTTLYAHNSQLEVHEGQYIKKGDLIALAGSSGSSTGPHLHYEVLVDGLPTDPLYYIRK